MGYASSCSSTADDVGGFDATGQDAQWYAWRDDASTRAAHDLRLGRLSGFRSLCMLAARRGLSLSPTRRYAEGGRHDETRTRLPRIDRARTRRPGAPAILASTDPRELRGLGSPASLSNPARRDQWASRGRFGGPDSCCRRLCDGSRSPYALPATRSRARTGAPSRGLTSAEACWSVPLSLSSLPSST